MGSRNGVRLIASLVHFRQTPDYSAPLRQIFCRRKSLHENTVLMMACSHLAASEHIKSQFLPEDVLSQAHHGDRAHGNKPKRRLCAFHILSCGAHSSILRKYFRELALCFTAFSCFNSGLINIAPAPNERQTSTPIQ